MTGKHKKAYHISGEKDLENYAKQVIIFLYPKMLLNRKYLNSGVMIKHIK